MGNATKSCCGPSFAEQFIAKNNGQQLTSLILNKQATTHIEEYFPTFISNAQRIFNQALPQCRSVIKAHQTKVNERVPSQNRTSPARSQIQKFNQLLKQAESQFLVRKKYLLSSLQNQKNMYVAELQANMPQCAQFNQLSVSEQEQVFKQMRSIMKTKIAERKSAEERNFNRKMAVEQLQKNLLSLDSVQRSETLAEHILEQYGHRL